MATVTLLYFASVREAIGASQEECDLPPEVETPRQLVAWLTQRSPAHEAAFREPFRLRCAIDQTMVDFDTPMGVAREIAIFPPVTGG